MDGMWKDIPGYEGKYQASSEGRIKSLERVIHSSNQNGEFDLFIKGKNTSTRKSR